MSPEAADGGDVGGREEADNDAPPGQAVGRDGTPETPSDEGPGLRTRLSVTVDDEHAGSILQVVEALRGRGMEVEAVLEGLGMVTGSAPDAAALLEVQGVSAVDAEVEHRLPLPDEEIQ